MSGRKTRKEEIKRNPDIVLEGSSPWRLPWGAPENAEPEWVPFERKLNFFLNANARFVDSNRKGNSATYHLYGCTVRKYSDLREAGQRVKGRDHCEYVIGVEIYGSISFSNATARRIMDIRPGYLARVEERR
jgi:hypothetical protein